MATLHVHKQFSTSFPVQTSNRCPHIFFVLSSDSVPLQITQLIYLHSYSYIPLTHITSLMQIYSLHHQGMWIAQLRIPNCTVPNFATSRVHIRSNQH